MDEKLINQDPTGLPLQTCEMSALIYVIISDHENICYRIPEIKRIFLARFGQAPSAKYTAKILKTLAARRLIEMVERPDPERQNQPTLYYSKSKESSVLMGSPIFRIMEHITVLTQKNGNSNTGATDLGTTRTRTDPGT